jgi:hypothetical protein
MEFVSARSAIKRSSSRDQHILIQCDKEQMDSSHIKTVHTTPTALPLALSLLVTLRADLRISSIPRGENDSIIEGLHSRSTRAYLPNAVLPPPPSFTI